MAHSFVYCVDKHVQYDIFPRKIFFSTSVNNMVYGLWVYRVRVMVFNATLNNISVISWRSVLLVEETRVPGENHRPGDRH